MRSKYITWRPTLVSYGMNKAEVVPIPVSSITPILLLVLVVVFAPIVLLFLVVDANDEEEEE